MTSLGDAVYQMVTGGLDLPATGDWQVLAAGMQARHGSVAAAARAAGIPRRTWRDWVTKLAAGKTVRPKQATLDKLARGWQVQPIAESAVKLNTRDRADDRPRTLTNSNLCLTPGTLKRAAAEYVATGDREAAARVFLAGIGDSSGFYVRYLTPRAADTPSVAPDEGDEGEPDEIDDLDEYDEWYDDLSGEGSAADGDSDTFSGGVITSVG